jgi:hypothetical protein
MDERLIRQALEEQARKDIPDDMNLIPEVYERVGRGTRAAARSRLSWVAVAVLGMLAVTVVAYAAARLLQDSPRDPGLTGAGEADLVTELNLQQSYEDFTVTVEYAYADVNRISIGFQVSGTSPIGTTYEITSDALTDSEGYEYQLLFGGGGGGGGGGSEAPQVHTYSYTQSSSYHVPAYAEVPDALNLRLELGVKRITSTRPDSAGTPQPVEGAPIIEQLEPLVFEFSVPFIPGQVIEPEQTASANGITLTLEKLVIAPSLTRATVCFAEVPEANYFPLVSLTVDGEAVALASEQGSGFEPVDEAGRCYDVLINESLYSLPGEWALSIDRFLQNYPVGYSSGSDGTTADYTISGPPEELARVRAQLEPGLDAYGIALDESDGSLSFSFALNSGIDQHEINGLLNRSVRSETEGPWVFTFDVPPAP